MIIECSKYNIILDYLSISKINDYINFNKYSKIILLTEKKLFNLWWKKIQKYFPSNIKVIKINSGELMKNIQTATKIWQKMIALNLDRKSLLINFGGGMISDLGGFIASTYMRGVDFINIPTTLLSMVDASIGGKNAINLKNVKNIIGTFNDPKLVLIDVNFLETLDRRELKSAFAEIIKHGVIHNKDYFETIENTINTSSKSELVNIIKESLEIKKYIVENDFYEQNIRKILNFGHTVGHAIETVSFKTNYPLLHGEAVAIGMIIEANIAKTIGMLNKENEIRIKNCITKCGFEELLKIKLTYNNIEELTDIILKDKKNEDNKIKLALPTEIGKCEHNIEVNLDIIKTCLESFFKS